MRAVFGSLSARFLVYPLGKHFSFPAPVVHVRQQAIFTQDPDDSHAYAAPGIWSSILTKPPSQNPAYGPGCIMYTLHIQFMYIHTYFVFGSGKSCGV